MTLPTWRTYPNGTPPNRSLLWLGETVVGMVIPGDPYWSTYYLVGEVMERGTKCDDEISARLVVEAALGSRGVV